MLPSLKTVEVVPMSWIEVLRPVLHSLRLFENYVLLVPVFPLLLQNFYWLTSLFENKHTSAIICAKYITTFSGFAGFSNTNNIVKEWVHWSVNKYQVFAGMSFDKIFWVNGSCKEFSLFWNILVIHGNWIATLAL